MPKRNKLKTDHKKIIAYRIKKMKQCADDISNIYKAMLHTVRVGYTVLTDSPKIIPAGHFFRIKRLRLTLESRLKSALNKAVVCRSSYQYADAASDVATIYAAKHLLHNDDFTRVISKLTYREYLALVESL